MSSVLWLPWVSLLCAAALVGAVLAWRRGRRASAVRWVGWAAVPWAAWFLGLVSLVARVSDAAVDWAARLAFNPAAWTGLALAVVAVALITLGGRLGRSGSTTVPARTPAQPAARRSDDDDIEAILRKHGIS